MTDNRFQQKLREQLTFIDTSCAAYDAGHRSEAVRIGTSLRTLLHDSHRSTSLLTHLGAKKVPMLSTCRVGAGHSSDPRFRPLAFDGLAGFSSAGPIPKLGAGSTKIELPADEWWQQPVIGIGPGRILSREVIACTAANKDGGAHVDAELPPDYATLGEGVWASIGGAQIGDHHLLYLRQMGYEVLNSPKLVALAI